MIGAKLLEHVRKAAGHLEQAGAPLPLPLVPELDEAAEQDHDESAGHFDPHDTDEGEL